jgi:branched-chain amino acid transport system permease protein
MKLSNWLDWQLVAGLFVIAVAAAIGVSSPSEYVVQVVTLGALYAAVASAWSIAGGMGGMLLLGIISFFGVGAYTNAILFTKYGISPWLNLMLGFLVAAALGRLIAAITLRFGLSEDYFAMFTVGISQVIKHLLLNWDYAGRATGIYITVVEDNFLMMSFVSRKPYLVIGLLLLLGILWISYRIQKSEFGYRLAAIRLNNQAAEAVGIDSVRTKTHAIVLSAGLAGMIGAFYSQFASFIDPAQVFSLATNFEMLLGSVLGGRLTIIGPLLGSAVLKPIQDVMRGLMGGGADALYLVFYGGLLVAACLLLPKGIAQYIQNWHKRYYDRKARRAERSALQGGAQ